MKVKAVDVFVLKFDRHYRLMGREHTPGLLPGTDYYFEPHWPQPYSRKMECCLVKLTADDGMAGWGEAQVPIVPEVAAELIVRLLGPVMLGRDPTDPAARRRELDQMLAPRGLEVGYAADAMSVLEMACWDLAGRSRNLPIAKLLHDAPARELPAYVSGLRRPTATEQAQRARELVAQGYGAFKLFVGHGVEADLATAGAIREAVGSTPLFADALWRYSRDEARELARGLSALRFDWLEAPLAPDDLDGHRELQQSGVLPIAAGETFRAAREFAPWLREGTLAVIQPDVLRSGISRTFDVARQAQRLGIAVDPHVGVCMAIGLAATWQTAAALPGFHIQEFQLDLFESANKVLTTPLRVSNGRCVVPAGPGLGVDVDEAWVREHATQVHHVA